MRGCYLDREEGGRTLARAMRAYDHRPDTIVLAINRGGVPVAFALARALGLPFDVLGPRGPNALNDDPPPVLDDRTVILVDEGLVTATPARIAAISVRNAGAREVVIGAPAGAGPACRILRQVAEEVICPVEREILYNTECLYYDCAPVSDEEVGIYIDRARGHRRVEVRLCDGELTLEGDLTMPPRPRALVLLAQSLADASAEPERHVLSTLHDRGFATVRADLLTPGERIVDCRGGEFSADVRLLGERLVVAAEWVRHLSHKHRLPMGCYGSAGRGAAALLVANRRPGTLGAVVSRGAAAGLARPLMRGVSAPALLIIAGPESSQLTTPPTAPGLVIAAPDRAAGPAADHAIVIQEAPRAVGRLVADWFDQHLPAAG